MEKECCNNGKCNNGQDCIQQKPEALVGLSQSCNLQLLPLLLVLLLGNCLYKIIVKAPFL